MGRAEKHRQSFCSGCARPERSHGPARGACGRNPGPGVDLLEQGVPMGCCGCLHLPEIHLCIIFMLSSGYLRTLLCGGCDQLLEAEGMQFQNVCKSYTSAMSMVANSMVAGVRTSNNVQLGATTMNLSCFRIIHKVASQ